MKSKEVLNTALFCEPAIQKTIVRLCILALLKERGRTVDEIQIDLVHSGLTIAAKDILPDLYELDRDELITMNQTYSQPHTGGKTTFRIWEIRSGRSIVTYHITPKGLHFLQKWVGALDHIIGTAEQ